MRKHKLPTRQPTCEWRSGTVLNVIDVEEPRERWQCFWHVYGLDPQGRIVVVAVEHREGYLIDCALHEESATAPEVCIKPDDWQVVGVTGLL